MVMHFINYTNEPMDCVANHLKKTIRIYGHKAASVDKHPMTNAHRTKFVELPSKRTGQNFKKMPQLQKDGSGSVRFETEYPS